MSHVPLYGDNILYLYRALSIFSAGLTLVCLFFGFAKYLGLPWGLLVLFLMNSSKMFHGFGSDNRPYMMWVFIFSALLIVVFVGGSSILE